MSDISGSTDWLDVAHQLTDEDDLSLSFPDPLDKSHFENALEHQSSVSQATDEWPSDIESTASTTNQSSHDENLMAIPHHMSDSLQNTNADNSLSSSARTIKSGTSTHSPFKLVVFNMGDFPNVSQRIKSSFIKSVYDNISGFVIEKDHTKYIINASNPDICFPVNDEEWRKPGNFFQLYFEDVSIDSDKLQDSIFKILLENLPTIVVIPTNALNNETIMVYANALKLKSKLKIIKFDLDETEGGLDEETLTLNELTNNTASHKLRSLFGDLEGTETDENFAAYDTKEHFQPEKVEEKYNRASLQAKLTDVCFSTCSVFGLLLVSMLALNVFKLATEGSYDTYWLSKLNNTSYTQPGSSSSADKAPSCHITPSLSFKPLPMGNYRLKTIDQAKPTTDLSIFNQVLDVVAHIPKRNALNSQTNQNELTLREQLNIDTVLSKVEEICGQAYVISLYYLDEHLRQIAALVETLIGISYTAAEIGYENAKFVTKHTIDYTASVYNDVIRHAPPVIRKHVRHASKQINRLSQQAEYSINDGISYLNKKSYNHLKRARDNYRRVFNKFV
ncbi:hypothetical protein E3Q04_04254 [Wallemia mellicola]|nr:hypothetical protein E3Q04_04254 [Wallemia mellicola]